MKKVQNFVVSFMHNAAVEVFKSAISWALELLEQMLRFDELNSEIDLEDLQFQLLVYGTIEN